VGSVNPKAPALKVGLRIMRAILALGIALLFCNSSARAQSADELLQACETLERTMTISGDKVSFAQTQPNYECWYFMGAVQQYATFVDPAGQVLLGACTGKTTKLTQLIPIFTKYARSHPQLLNEKAAVVAFQAMQSAFPCN
jgi:hypothetical protein